MTDGDNIFRQLGRSAAKNGLSSCPFGEEKARAAWMQGYQEQKSWRWRLATLIQRKLAGVDILQLVTMTCLLSIMTWASFSGLGGSGRYGRDDWETSRQDDLNYPDSPPAPSAECTSNCEGHLAGYEWAESNSLTDIEDCRGNSQSFTEGCQQYITETSDQ